MAPLIRYQFLGLSLLAAATSFAQQEDDVLQVFAHVRSQEIVSREADGSVHIDNAATRLLEAVLEEAGVDYELQVHPWTRTLQTVTNQPNILAYPVARTSAREDSLFWIGTIRPLELELYGLRSRFNELPKTLEAARNYRIGVFLDEVADDYLQQLGFEKLVHFSGKADLLSMLTRGRVDLIPFGKRGIAELVSGTDFPSDDLVPVIGLDGIESELQFALSRQSSLQLKNRLRAAYLRVVGSGRYSQIMAIKNQAGFFEESRQHRYGANESN